VENLPDFAALYQKQKRAPEAGLLSNLCNRKLKGEVENKKPHRNAVYNSSFELLRNRWNPIDYFRLPVKACRPEPK